MSQPRLVLASASPRRRQLLKEYGYAFSVEPADVAEVVPPHLTVAEITLFNAKGKALAVARRQPEAVVLGVDTLVALEGRCLGKPADLGEAAAMLRHLSGRVHEVFSGVWIASPKGGVAHAFVEASYVRFRPLDEAAIARYLARIDPLDKAGAYAAQDESAETVVEAIEGSRTNVIGLPMEALGKALEKLGITPRGYPAV